MTLGQRRPALIRRPEGLHYVLAWRQQLSSTFALRWASFAYIHERKMACHPKLAANCHAASEGWSGKRDSNPRLRPWQGRTLPLSYSRPNLQSTIKLAPNAILEPLPPPTSG